MKNYYKIMLGHRSKYADECFAGGFIGADFNVHQDITMDLYDDWRDFNHKYIPLYLQANPEKSRIAAGLACAAIWTIAKGINVGDIVLSPNGKGSFMIGVVISEYSYHGGQILPHRRSVQWYTQTVVRATLSPELRSSTKSQGTVSQIITKHAGEIESIIQGWSTGVTLVEDKTIEDPSVFALEKHLEEFLVQNWAYTELGKEYDIYQEEGEIVGQQYPSDTGPIDILALSKDKKQLLVVELKKGRASDSVIGQIQRYMGYVKEELAEPNQTVRGVIIALEEDVRIKRALSVTSNIDFFRYQVSFKLLKT
jgi:restriction system protein